MKISFDQSSKVMSAPLCFTDDAVLITTGAALGAWVIVTSGPSSPGSRNTLDGQSVNIDKLRSRG